MSSKISDYSNNMTASPLVNITASIFTSDDDNSTIPCLNCSKNNTGMNPNSEENSSQEVIMRVVTTIVIGFGMIGIGASVNYLTLWKYIKQPKAYLLGVSTQLLIMPLIAWAFTRIFSMPFGEALGVFIQGCSPGGSTSNVVVYWIDGVVDLSVVMTGTSTLLSMGMLPLWLFIYAKGENRMDELKIPYDSLALSLVLLIVPVAIGVVVNAKCPKKAPIISKISITIASIFILIMVIVKSVLSQIPWIVTWRQAVVAAIMPLVSLFFGYLVTILPGVNLSGKCSRTIAVETALQNAQIASAVIYISFGTNIPLLIQMILFPLLYYVFQVGYSAILAAVFLFAKKKGYFVQDEQSESDEEKAPNSCNVENGKINPTFEKDTQ